MAYMNGKEVLFAPISKKLTTKTITANGTYNASADNADGYSSVTANIVKPQEITTESEMTALLKTAEIGSIYKYTGTTGTYENGAIYIVEAI